MSKSSEAVRKMVKATLAAPFEQMMALDEKAWAAWDAAYDAARAKDQRAGRRYDKDRYAEAATKARAAVFTAALEAAQ